MFAKNQIGQFAKFNEREINPSTLHIFEHPLPLQGGKFYPPSQEISNISRMNLVFDLKFLPMPAHIPHT